MSVLWVPYHLDEYLPGLDLPMQPDEVITAALPAGDVWTRLATLYAVTARAVADVTRSGGRPVVVSGDCTTALGTMAGLQQVAPGLDPAVVWFDAHGDVQTLETTASGYLGGLPLRLLAGYRPELIAARLGLRPVPEQRIVLAGARDLDPPEVAYLDGARIHRTGLTALRPGDLPPGPLYLHVDLDVLDPAEVPGLRFPAPGGATAGAATGALRTVLGTGQVAAVGIACSWRPGHAAAAAVSPWLNAVFAA